MVLFSVLLIFTVFVIDIGKRKFAESLPFCLFSIILLQYFCVLMGIKKAATILCLILCIVAAAVLIYRVRKRKARMQTLSELRSPVFIVFVLLMIALYFTTRAYTVIGGDDLNHWAVFLKQLFYRDNFPDLAQSCSIYTDYPPGAQMLELWFTGLSRDFYISDAYFARYIFTYAMLLPVLEILEVRAHRSVPGTIIKYAAVCVIYCLLPVFMSPYGLRELKVDTLMGFVFAYVLYCCVRENSKKLFDYLLIGLSLSVLCLIKMMALAFALGAITVFLLCEKRKKIGILVSVCSLIPMGLWLIRCQIGGLTSYLHKGFQVDVSLWEIGKQFGKEFIFSPLNESPIGFSALAFLLLFAVLAVRLRRTYCCNKKKLITVTAVLMGGLVLYSLTLIYLYASVLSQEPGLPSFQRYIAPYITGLVCFAGYMTVEKLKEETGTSGMLFPNRSNLIVLCVLLGVIVLCSNYMLTPFGFFSEMQNQKKEWKRIETELELPLAYLGKGAQGPILILSSNEPWDMEERCRRYVFNPAKALTVNVASMNEIKEKLSSGTYFFLYCCPNVAEENVRELNILPGQIKRL